MICSIEKDENEQKKWILQMENYQYSLSLYPVAKFNKKWDLTWKKKWQSAYFFFLSLNKEDESVKAVSIISQILLEDVT